MPGTFGLDATGGGAGFGLFARELPGREFAGVESLDESATAAVFFQGAAEPLAGIIPGNTETGLAFTSAARDFTGVAAGFGVDATAGGGG